MPLFLCTGTTLCKYMGTHLSFMQFFRTKDKSYAMSGFGWALDAKPHPYVVARLNMRSSYPHARSTSDLRDLFTVPGTLTTMETLLG